MLDQKRIQELSEVEEKIDYQFRNKDLLNQALYHSSYANENQDKTLSNERLEFLGDAVVGLIVSDLLYKKEDGFQEGEMTKKRSRLVCEPSFANMARQLGLGEYLQMGRGEELSGGRNRDSILADAFEALIAAVYLDSGFNGTQIYFEEVLSEKLLDYLNYADQIKDYKTTLQEYFQKAGKQLKYSIDKEIGPEHEKVFYASVHSEDKPIGSGVGKNKKSAEQAAAQNAIEILGIRDEL
ncbi:ribonuclease III [Gallicola sp. Sow4_E12]|uniref:ribonuclease III n=1 Tax=Gallicola sp. Sow4_E12 TaxID=3438785 RepID=UPI003F90FE83